MFSIIVCGLLSAYTLLAGLVMANALNPDLNLPSLNDVVERDGKR